MILAEVTPAEVVSTAQTWANTILALVAIAIGLYLKLKTAVHAAGVDTDIAHLKDGMKANRTAADKALELAPSLAQVAPSGIPPVVMKASLLIFGLLFTSCATSPTAPVAKAQAWLASPTGQVVASDVNAAVNVSEVLYPQEAPAIGTASLALRSLETNQLPTAPQIQSAVISIAGAKSSAAKLAPTLAMAVSSAAISGVPPAASVEAVATILDKAKGPAK